MNSGKNRVKNDRFLNGGAKAEKLWKVFQNIVFFCMWVLSKHCKYQCFSALMMVPLESSDRSSTDCLYNQRHPCCREPHKQSVSPTATTHHSFKAGAGSTLLFMLTSCLFVIGRQSTSKKMKKTVVFAVHLKPLVEKTLQNTVFSTHSLKNSVNSDVLDDVRPWRCKNIVKTNVFSSKGIKASLNTMFLMFLV